MDRGHLNKLYSILHDLTIGRYPITDDLPLLLNLHQSRFALAEDDRPMVYFHPTIIQVPHVKDYTSATKDPEVNIFEHAREDMQRKWRVLRKTYRSTSEQPVFGTDRDGLIWDRELIWHDVYPEGRKERRNAIHQFWTRATTNFLPDHLHSSEQGSNTIDTRQPERIRYKTVYHEWNPSPAYLPPPPRDTIFFVLATAMFHINEATYDDQVVMSKTWEYVAGHRTELIPRLVFCGLTICLESGFVPEDDIERQSQFLRKFGVSKRLVWLREGLQSCIGDADWPPEFLDALRL
ncbi:hypothetical protein PG994_004475 [Apiospora phragmitis]|uniref:Uncharacterized protein n=1 Tax=Apiospora phragmitis TaxID=2905665 RepID=A0ABR1VQQ3_9PEZI